MIWEPATCANLARPSRAIPLLEAAIAQAPKSGVPYFKLGSIHLDNFDFQAALPCFEAAVQLEPSDHVARSRLARTYNVLGRFSEALHVATAAQPMSAQLLTLAGMAQDGLGDRDDAERCWRDALVLDAEDTQALTKLSGLLRRTGRLQELMTLIEGLAARHARNARVLLDWGRALLLSGEQDKAKALLFDPARVRRRSLPVPPDFANIEAFNAALAEEILGNPVPVSDFPDGEQANRGSTRVHNLLAGQRPSLITALLDALQREVEAFVTALAPQGAFDPWIDARPGRAHLHPWGLIQRGEAFEEWHTHRGGWLSGVYYIRVPKGLSEEDGRGCIEFGPPPSVAALASSIIEAQRYAPIEGTLLLAPSHYHHRTIPSGRDEYRISFAFDVVSDDKPTIP